MNWKLNWGILVFAGSLSGTPAGEVVATWNFNRLSETNAPPAATGTGTASLVGGVNGSFASGVGSSDPEPAATDSAWNLSGFPARSDIGAIAGAGFAAGTTGYRDVQVRCDLRPSNTASRRGRFQYSTDGTVFVDGSAFTLETGGDFAQGLLLDLTGVASANDNPRFAFRVVAVPDGPDEFGAVSGRYSPTGTWRLDMVTVSGTPLVPKDPEPPGPSVPTPVRFTNLLTQVVRPGDAPINTFPDQAVAPGERLEIRVEFGEPGARPYRVALHVNPEPPAGSGWLEGPGDGPHDGVVSAGFVFTPTADDEGRTFHVEAVASHEGATNRVGWRIHVPTPSERGIVLTEFLANPGSDPESPAFNPLRRDPPSARPGQHDEYLEVVNFHSAPVELQGWRVRDSSGWRHLFREPQVIGPSNVLILHGGPSDGPAPGLDVPAVPVGEGIVGLSLNNDGDVIAFYNAEANLVFRVVYTPAMMTAADGGSLARAPDRDGGFVPQSGFAGLTVTPGRRSDGGRFEEPTAGVGDPAEIRLTWTWDAPGILELRWEAEAAASYSVWTTEVSREGRTPWVEVAAGLVFPEGRGRHAIPIDPGRGARFFRVDRR